MTSLAIKPVKPDRIAALVVVMPLLALLMTLWPSLHYSWIERSTYSHGYLVLGIALWLCVREVRRAPIGPFFPSLLGVSALALFMTIAAMARAADAGVLQQLSIPAILVTSLWAVAGWPSARRFLIPAGYTLFAMPVWDVVNESLRALTVLVTTALTRLSSIPAFIEGNIIQLPSGTFEIADGCSGLHYLIVACALGALYGLLNFQRWLPRIGILVIAVVLAVIANWIRVFVIIVAGHFSEMQHYLVTVDHYYFGWALFFVVFAPLLFFGRYLDISMEEGRVSGHVGGVAGRVRRSAKADLLCVMLTGFLLTSFSWLSFQAGARPTALAGGESITLPGTIAGWQYEGAWDAATRPRFVNSDREGSGRYGHQVNRVSVFVAHYLVQDQGKEVVFYANVPAGVRGEILRHASVSHKLSSGEFVPLTELEVANGNSDRRLVWYVYQVAGMRTGNPLIAKLYQVVGAFRRQWDAQVIVVSSDCETDCSGARESLALFAEDGVAPMFRLVQGKVHLR